jgi:thiol:disulfide interchange protein DsbD
MPSPTRPAALAAAVALASLALAPSAHAAPAGFAAAAADVDAEGWTVTDHLRSRLVPRMHAARPGEPLQLGLLLEHAPHWHTYWRNPGDSGLPTRLRWILPEGVEAGPIDWPLPTRFDLDPLVNYGYEGRVLLPVTLAVPADLTGDTLELEVRASWLVCQVECIPGGATFALSLPVERGAEGRPARPRLASAWAADFSGADARQPTLAWPSLRARIAVDDGQAVVALDGDWPEGIEGWTLFPATPQLLEHDALPAWTRADGGWRLRTPASPFFAGMPPRIELLLSDGRRGIAIDATPDPTLLAPAAGE